MFPLFKKYSIIPNPNGYKTSSATIISENTIPMNNQLEKWHSDCHEASHLISEGKINEAQEILAKMDYEMHDAINENQNK